MPAKPVMSSPTSTSGADGPATHPILGLLRMRRSPKLASLTAPGPTEAQRRDMLTIAARVPDHAKLVPWRFIIIEGDGGQRIGAL